MTTPIPPELRESHNIEHRSRYSAGTRIIALTLIVLLMLGAGATAFFMAIS